jgi:protein TonB
MAEAHISLIKARYPITVRIMGLAAVLIIVAAFILFPRFLSTSAFENTQSIVIEQIDIPLTQQLERSAPPARPSVPVESESEDIADDLTIEETDLGSFEAWDAPPPPPSGPQVRFIPYDDPPVPLTKIDPVYPEIAQEAGIEGTVIIQAFIDHRGRVQETIVLKGVPNTGLDDAAADAIRRTRFRPAKQRERAVGVWISIPVHFTLRN